MLLAVVDDHPLVWDAVITLIKELADGHEVTGFNSLDDSTAQRNSGSSTWCSWIWACPECRALKLWRRSNRDTRTHPWWCFPARMTRQRFEASWKGARWGSS